MFIICVCKFQCSDYDGIKFITRYSDTIEQNSHSDNYSIFLEWCCHGNWAVELLRKAILWALKQSRSCETHKLTFGIRLMHHNITPLYKFNHLKWRLKKKIPSHLSNEKPIVLFIILYRHLQYLCVIWEEGSSVVGSYMHVNLVFLWGKKKIRYFESTQMSANDEDWYFGDLSISM
jgi:hypothetical protein